MASYNPTYGSSFKGAPAYSRFDFTQQWTGLASQGIDYKNPNARFELTKWLKSQPSAVQAGVKKGASAYGGDIVQGADWWFRDNQRKSQKTNGLLSGTLGKVLLGGAVALGGLGLAGIGPLGGVLGGASGAAGAGSAASGVSALGSGIGSTASLGLGSGAAGLISPTFASIGTVGAAGAVGSTGLGLTAASLFTPAALGGAAAAGGGILGKIGAAYNSPIGKGARILSAGNSAKNLLAGGAAAGATVVGLNALRRSTGLGSGPPQPASITRVGSSATVTANKANKAADNERKRAASLDDGVNTSLLGVRGSARTRKKQLLGA